MQIIRTECMVAVIVITLLFLSGSKERKDDSVKLKKHTQGKQCLWKSNGKIHEARAMNSLKCLSEKMKMDTNI